MEELPICGLDGFSLNAQMRCFRVSKGGVKYELIVSPANYSKSTRRSLPVARSMTSLSLVDIQRKQDEAEIRRVNQRSTRIPSQHLHHIDKVRENKRKSISDFRSAIKKGTEQKMWNSEITRENRMKSVQVKNLKYQHLSLQFYYNKNFLLEQF